MSIINFPKWKKNLTPIDSLREMLRYAESNPDDVTSLVVLWMDEKKRRRFECSNDVMVSTAVLLLEATKIELLKDM